ncbi:hypothetical protein [Vibrio sp. 10N.261.55.A7]|uniref:hypothetical protein n=1 Tax=Vibrio sp. 10N.261.55.A7 TaxID=1880851 RepID=UPI000C830693|nr:hypothetical protein [Vibrio sp. 10N.261.55.A7]PMJ98918.1 hypothetical protein BCU12_21385 [Vibrio sp. 10N.261.55.A7]
MYQSIQIAVGYSIFRLNDEGPIGVSKRNDGMISALLKRGDRFSAPFGGFVETKNVLGLKKVKLLDVKFLCSDREGVDVEYAIPREHYLVGGYIESRLCILLFDGKVKHYLRKDADQKDTNNVFGLF